MMNSTERIISFHRRQTIHLFHFGSSCHIQNMIFIKCQLNFIEKDFFYLIFCLYLPNVRLFTLQEPIRFGAARTSSSSGAKKGHNTKKLKMHFFLRLSQRAFALDTKGTFTIFVPTSRVTVREKKSPLRV